MNTTIVTYFVFVKWKKMETQSLTEYMGEKRLKKKKKLCDHYIVYSGLMQCDAAVALHPLLCGCYGVVMWFLL